MLKDERYLAAAEKARDAVLMASPFSELPKEKYEHWKDFEFTFDPSQFL